jgi:hypothetical protein
MPGAVTALHQVIALNGAPIRINSVFIHFRIDYLRAGNSILV